MPKPTIDRPVPSAHEKRLARLVGLAKAGDFWERLWRGLIPPLVIVGLFLCVSWLGLWFDVPHLGRMIGVGLFAILLLVSCYGLRDLGPLSRKEALARIDRSSGLAHRPASVLDDTLATAGRDPATDALWALHRRRAESDAARLRAPCPSPRAVDLDRYALRFGIVVALIACALIAGPQRYARVAAAFDFGDGDGRSVGYRLDAWIDPPAYTGNAPILLDLAADTARNTDHPLRIAAPAGAIVVIRSSGGRAAEVETTGPLLPVKPKLELRATDGGEPADAKAQAGPSQVASSQGASSQGASSQGASSQATLSPTIPLAGATPSNGDSETRLVLHGDSRLTLRHGGSLRGIFDLVAIADKPPTIALREIPKANARGSLTLAYTVGDDYGVTRAEARFANPKIDGEPTEGRSLVPPPKIDLSLPGLTNGMGEGETTADLSEHPWAGAQVTMTLVAHDDGGNEGSSEPVTITLPQKPFVNPLARALVEQRRDLVLNPGRRARVGAALDALMIAPQAFGTKASVYLGLRFAADSLAHADDDKRLVEVADFLWSMALQLENGDLSDAEKALRDAEKALRDAIENKASDEEIQKLTQNLQAAMDKFLKELAQQQDKDDQQRADNRSGKPSKTISQKDLQALIDKLKEKARSGNREEAKKALDELQDILENLKTAKRQKADPQSRAMAEGLNQLDQAMRDQQDLRDETFRKGQQDPNQGQQGQGQGRQDGSSEGEMPGASGKGQSQGEGQNQGEGQGAEQDQGADQSQGSSGGKGARSGQGPQGEGQGKSLGARQRELRDRLAQIQKKLKKAGEGQGALDDAAKDMHEAEDALREGDGSNGQAVDAQGRALDALRKGAKKLADSLQQQQGSEPGGQANSEGEGGEGSQDGQQTGSSDPLGRPRGGNSINSTSRFDPLGIPAAQRAQRVLEELRRRLGDPTRNQEEIEYLERLLRSY